MTDNEEWGNISLPGLSDDQLLTTNWNRVTAGKQNKHNPKLKQLAASKKNNAEFSDTMREVAGQRDDQYRQAQKQGCQSRDNSYQAQTNARAEVQAKISASMKAHTKSQEHVDKVAAQNRLRSKPIMTIWGEFPSRRAAVAWALENTDIVNVDKKIQKWVKSLDSGFYYIKT